MRAYLRRLLGWFSSLIRRLTRRSPHTSKSESLSNRNPEIDVKKADIDLSHSSIQESLTSNPQKPSNYPSMPRRELLIDNPFQVKPPTSSSSTPVQREAADNRVTPKPSPGDTTQRTDDSGQNRPYIKYGTDELDRLANQAWHNPTVLVALQYELQFRSRKKAQTLLIRISERLAQLQNTEFTWPKTTATSGTQTLLNDVFKHEQGLLRNCGYKVGLNGLPEKKRRQILDDIFLRALPVIPNVCYLNEWGDPSTAKRLRKLAESIAAFTRNAKRQNKSSFSKAIQDWEADLAYLKQTYYDGHFSFQWPATNVPL